MKILVCVKRVIDPNVHVHVKSDGSGIESEGVKMSMNPFDEVAVEKAVQLKEQGVASEVLLLCIGPAAARDTLRTGLAMGADRALLVETDVPVEPLAVAKIIRSIIAEETPTLVLLGKQAIDSDSAQCAPMLAGLLGWPQATFASALGFEGSTLQVTRETDSGTERISMPLPAVVSADLRLAEPRYASLPSVIKAKKKPMDVRRLDSLGIDIAHRLVTLQVMAANRRRQGTIVHTVAELLTRLRDEAKVL